jgi:tetrahydromethanopterin S-methyltransferase subunit C
MLDTIMSMLGTAGSFIWQAAYRQVIANSIINLLMAVFSLVVTYAISRRLSEKMQSRREKKLEPGYSYDYRDEDWDMEFIVSIVVVAFVTVLGICSLILFVQNVLSPDYQAMLLIGKLVFK